MDLEYSPEEYLEEKRNGSRLPNGAMPLKRLTAKHKQIILMHLSGLSNNEIALASGRTPVSISRILHDPLAEPEISRLLKDTEKEFEALYPKSVERLREAMDAETLAKTPAYTTRLKAVDIYFRASGKYQDADTGKETAEDVIQRILQNPLVQVNINTNVGELGEAGIGSSPTISTPSLSNSPSILEGELSDGDNRPD